ncbi:MAG: hypothetical protein N2593_00390 [Patescibacteria group bacterium]|nr:hypothetical protein [Patescibacteria group bacterium]
MEKNPQLIFSWRAPLRPYKKKSKLIVRFYLGLAFLLSSIFFFFGDKVLIIPIWSILFLFYILTITPPPEVENKITAFGIDSAGIVVRWENLSYFYFEKKFGFYTLTIVGQPPYYYHFYMVVPNESTKNKLISILSQYLLYQEKPQKNIGDKIIDFLSQLVPDETEEETENVLKKLKDASLLRQKSDPT